MTALWVMPSIDRAFGDACAAGLAGRALERVDNWPPNRNRGVAASWNLGADRVLAGAADWLVIVSESVRFGPARGLDVEGALEGQLAYFECDRSCTEVADTGAGFCRRGFGWHLIGIHCSLLRKVGRFDEAFWPAWWEENDWMRRLELAGGLDLPLAPRRLADAHLAACEHSTAAGLVGGGWHTTLPLYLAKWGGQPGEERFARPYGR